MTSKKKRKEKRKRNERTGKAKGHKVIKHAPNKENVRQPGHKMAAPSPVIAPLIETIRPPIDCGVLSKAIVKKEALKEIANGINEENSINYLTQRQTGNSPQNLTRNLLPVDPASLREFLANITITDLSAPLYWIGLFLIALIFATGEIVILSTSSETTPSTESQVNEMLVLTEELIETPKILDTVLKLTGIFSLILLLMVFVYIALLARWYFSSNRRKIEIFFKKRLPAIIIVGTSFLLFINLYIVSETGWSKSVFLPGLLAMTSAVIFLVRSYNYFTATLAIFATIIAFMCLWIEGDNVATPIQNAALPVNIFSFFFTIIFSFYTKNVSSTKLPLNKDGSFI